MEFGMHPITDLIRATWRNYTGRKNGHLLLRFLAIFVTCVSLYSVLFHLVMAYEGQSFSWMTGLYWTLTVMSTLGLGDITFNSTLGHVFTIGVLVSGVMFLLVLLPLLFIESQSAARVSCELPRDTGGHVILCHYDEVTSALITRMRQYRQPYVLLVPDLTEALSLYDQGLNVVMGEVTHPDTFRQVRLAKAALVATTSSDAVNTNVALTVRELSASVPVIATANEAVAVDMLSLAGCSHVLHLGNMLGRSLARRIHGNDSMTRVIGQFGPLLIAEAAAARTPFVGTTLQQSRLRERVGLSVVGVWERGHFEMAGPDTSIGPHTVLVLAGSQAQLQQFDAHFGSSDMTDAPVLILGGGRVGRATGRALEERGSDYRIVEQLHERVDTSGKYILGNAARADVLHNAGIRDTPAVVITTHDDDLNIYLTLYCRHLRPDVQIISRATLERHVPTLHRAGADFVMSYASMGANAIWNLLQRNDVLMVTEGLHVFRVTLPPRLAGKTMLESRIRQVTGCHVIAIETEGVMQINPDPAIPFPDKAELILIGTTKAEEDFVKVFPAA
jgi:Trk K+ transport system NAD-binding subunit